jgi:glucose/arabinose dehydrogenase
MLRCFGFTISISLVLVFIGCGDGAMQTPPPAPSPTLALTPLVGSLNSPVDLQFPNDNTGRFFVVEQSGTIRIIANSLLLSGDFLDIASKITTGSEMGLLGLTFHPSYSQNRRFFVNYNRTVGAQLQTVIAEYQASASDANQADPASERVLLTVDQPFPNHKGGQLAFGPDGFLYIGLGDGGSGGDPFGNGRSLQTRLGKMLRIDVDRTDPGLQYAIPTDNPFAAGGGLPEIWAYGLRNPWRFSFESGTGRLFCADVGQDSFEEVDLLQNGGNFGWNTMEGLHCFNPSSSCNMTGLILPIAEYSHSEGEAVIGGYVYKGSGIPSLVGTYILGDYISGAIWGLKETTPGSWTRSRLLSTQRNISSFGQDAAGEVYVLDYSGNILKLISQ